ncbi:hypothetical protein LMG31506_00034 [Cupriavidus yeoncheonensis]|uniref:Pentapeptide repeat-containing protein n=1 Tax=Cupriavidus yeoncheonensis TaxID=1462994 RepID=A0A916MSU8_9BURK|nr:hypothetical protein [Cupriavidus yeoncheonensis]CAG2126549.1 hypothetical protein LMG31506_00034 [Cupriavidus yeoncheonensis]
MTAKNIDQMPHEFAMLTDAELRRKTLGEQPLKISGADFITLEAFYEATWENVHFYDCIFYGMTRLSLLKNCVFERCQFPGSNFQGYGWDNVLFVRCDTLGEVNLMGGDESKAVRFVECDFGGTKEDPNHWGAVGTWAGEVSFENCTGKFTNVFGRDAISYKDCRFGSIDLSGGDYDYKTGTTYPGRMLLDNVKSDGRLRLGQRVSSLTVRNSAFTLLDMAQFKATGAVRFDNVTASGIAANGIDAASFTMIDVVLTGDGLVALGDTVMDAGRMRADAILLERVKCRMSKASIALSGAGVREKLDPTQTAVPQIILRECAIPEIELQAVNALNVALQNVDAQTADFSESTIGTLTLNGTGIVRKIDFTKASVGQVSGLVRYTTQEIVTEGSNVKL